MWEWEWGYHDKQLMCLEKNNAYILGDLFCLIFWDVGNVEMQTGFVKIGVNNFIFVL